MWLEQLALKKIEKLLNLTLNLDPFLADSLKNLTGNSLAICVTNAPLHFVVYFSDTTVFLNPFDGATHTCHLEAPIHTLLMLCLTKKTKELQSPGVHVRGDLLLLSQIMQLIQQLDFDWEEHLSHYIGDIAAHCVGVHVQNFQEQYKKGKKTGEQNLSEYLQEELCVFPSRWAVDDFMSDVDTLYLDVDRMDKKIKRMLFKKEERS